MAKITQHPETERLINAAIFSLTFFYNHVRQTEKREGLLVYRVSDNLVKGHDMYLIFGRHNLEYTAKQFLYNGYDSTHVQGTTYMECRGTHVPVQRKN